MNQSVLTHQQQPCPTSCVSACFAMIMGVPVETVKGEIHAAYQARQLSLHDILTRYAIGHTAMRATDNNDFGSTDVPGVYLASIPSLNREHGLHEILIEVLPDDEWVVYDPCAGIPGKRFYTAVANMEPFESEEGISEPQFLTGNYHLEAFIEAKEVRRLQADQARERSGVDYANSGAEQVI